MENDKSLMNDIKEVYDKIQKNDLWDLATSTKLYGMNIPLPESIATNTLDTYADALLD